MEDLDKLSATGLPVFDLNSEHLDQKDWCDCSTTSRHIGNPFTNEEQVSITAGATRQLAVFTQMPRKLVHSAHAPLRRHLLGGAAHCCAQPGLVKGAW